jgi:hypothetical protein
MASKCCSPDRRKSQYRIRWINVSLDGHRDINKSEQKIIKFSPDLSNAASANVQLFDARLYNVAK